VAVKTSHPSLQENLAPHPSDLDEIMGDMMANEQASSTPVRRTLPVVAHLIQREDKATVVELVVAPPVDFAKQKMNQQGVHKHSQIGGRDQAPAALAPNPAQSCCYQGWPPHAPP
jgi:hypothetical protein